MSASTRGRRNRRAGNSAERELVRWLNDLYDLGAKTTRAVGHGTQSLHGDIMIPGHPDIVIEVKNTQTTQVSVWLDQLATECDGIDDPLAMLAWRTSPRVGEWVWIVADSHGGELGLTVDDLTTSAMNDIASAVRVGFDNIGVLLDGYAFLDWTICSGRIAADLIGERVVGGRA